MKTRLFRLMGWATLTVLVASFASSCGKEPMIHDGEYSLMISPSLPDMQNGRLVTRAIDLSDNNYNENTVDRLDVFFFKVSDNSFVTAYHPETLTSESYGSQTGYLLSKDWTGDGLEKNVAYRVFVIANSKNETITTATSGVTPASLQALVREEADIYKRKATADGDTYSKDKTFLMNAEVTWTITAPGNQFINDTQVTLTRAAVKFVMDVSLTSTFSARLAANDDEYGTPSWKYINFNTVTAEIPGGATPAAVLASRESGEFLKVETGTGEQAGHFTVVTYAYPQAFTSADTAPAILVSFPCFHGDSEVAAYHYYYIPLTSGLSATENNKIYKVNALISSYGSSEAITNDEVSLQYEVLDWGTSNSADIDAKLEDYLVVTPTHYTFKGGPTNDFLTTKIKYYASGPVSMDETITAFFIDLNGNSQPISSEQYEISEPANGEIEIKSKVPTNGTYQEVQFKVYVGTDSDRKKEETIYFRHYPLDFVSAESGSYSSYNRTDWAQYEQSGTYVHAFVSEGYFVFSGTHENPRGGFEAKLFNGSACRYLSTSGGDGGAISNIGNNNRAYILQITSASDSFTIGRPSLSTSSRSVYTRSGSGSWRDPYRYSQIATVSYSISNDDVISPAFMIASQLGAVTSSSDNGFTTHADAAMHCALYKEVLNGTEYTSWRLPTKQEVQYMVDNQYTHKQVMSKVLAGQFYWTLDGGYAENSVAAVEDPDPFVYTRCVRDLTADELAEINKFE